MHYAKVKSFYMSVIRSITLLGCIPGIITFPNCSPSKGPFSPIETISRDQLKGHIFYLGSDFLEGRLTGSEGYKQASFYLASQLRAAGLVPIVDGPEGKKSYFQHVNFVISKIASDSLLHLKKGQTEIKWRFGEQFIPLLHGQAFKDGIYQCPAEFVGYGIEEPDFGWNDYENRDVSGKIVIFYIGSPVKDGKPVLPEKKHNLYIDAVKSLRNRMMSVFTHQASGVVIIPDSLTAKMWFAFSTKMNSPTRRLKADVNKGGTYHIPIFLLHPEAAVDLFKDTDFDPISGKGNIESAPIKDINLIFNLKYEIEKDFICKNVIGYCPGSDPGLKDEYIVVGAHLDHLGMKEGDAFNGANDNASGCAAVLEAAEALAMHPQKRSIFFVFFTGEEGAGHGSYHFIANFPFSLDKIKLAINVDMVGGNPLQFPDSVLGVLADTRRSQLDEFMKRANESMAKVNLKTSFD
jgi:aminopeptidase YwaD